MRNDTYLKALRIVPIGWPDVPKISLRIFWRFWWQFGWHHLHDFGALDLGGSFGACQCVVLHDLWRSLRPLVGLNPLGVRAPVGWSLQDGMFGKEAQQWIQKDPNGIFLIGVLWCFFFLNLWVCHFSQRKIVFYVTMFHPFWVQIWGSYDFWHGKITNNVAFHMGSFPDLQEVW